MPSARKSRSVIIPACRFGSLFGKRSRRVAYDGPVAVVPWEGKNPRKLPRRGLRKAAIPKAFCTLCTYKHSTLYPTRQSTAHQPLTEGVPDVFARPRLHRRARQVIAFYVPWLADSVSTNRRHCPRTCQPRSGSPSANPKTTRPCDRSPSRRQHQHSCRLQLEQRVREVSAPWSPCFASCFSTSSQCYPRSCRSRDRSSPTSPRTTRLSGRSRSRSRASATWDGWHCTRDAR